MNREHEILILKFFFECFMVFLMVKMMSFIVFLTMKMMRLLLPTEQTTSKSSVSFQTRDRQRVIELNHRWVKCIFPFK